MNAPEPLVKEVVVALGVATIVVAALLTVVVRRLRRKLL
jgi:predicted RND superfamily exporter protein